MARPRSIDEDDLLSRLARVFSEVGYEGASLSVLSEATGLQRASLYHRFPGGKEQMAREVLASASGWLETHVFAVLASDAPPRERLEMVGRNLAGFYEGGGRACLLNMLSSPRIENGPFGLAIRDVFQRLINALAAFATEAGIPAVEARQRAERALMLLHGSLVLARGLGSTAPFDTFLAGLPGELLPQEVQP